MSAIVPELPLLARTLLALGIVITLVVAARWVAGQRSATLPSQRGEVLQVVRSLALDPRNRLVLVRHNGIELLLAVGPHGTTLLPAAATLPADAREQRSEPT